MTPPASATLSHLIEVTDEELQDAIAARLADLGLTADELKAQAARKNFDSTAARELWFLIGDAL
jgi:hypothetical protein